jgi:hypothetical protein
MLDAAETLADLTVPPGNRLEKLAADRAGQHSVRIKRQWRICFRWTNAGPEDMEIADHHYVKLGETMAADTVMAPVHPGEILLEEFLKPLAVSQYKLAKEIGSRPGGSRDRARPAPHQRRHGSAAGSVLRRHAVDPRTLAVSGGGRPGRGRG